MTKTSYLVTFAVLSYCSYRLTSALRVVTSGLNEECRGYERKDPLLFLISNTDTRLWEISRDAPFRRFAIVSALFTDLHSLVLPAMMYSTTWTSRPKYQMSLVIHPHPHCWIRILLCLYQTRLFNNTTTKCTESKSRISYRNTFVWMTRFVFGRYHIQRTTKTNRWRYLSLSLSKIFLK